MQSNHPISYFVLHTELRSQGTACGSCLSSATIISKCEVNIRCICELTGQQGEIDGTLNFIFIGSIQPAIYNTLESAMAFQLAVVKINSDLLRNIGIQVSRAYLGKMRRKFILHDYGVCATLSQWKSDQLQKDFAAKNGKEMRHFKFLCIK